MLTNPIATFENMGYIRLKFRGHPNFDFCNQISSLRETFCETTC